MEILADFGGDRLVVGQPHICTDARASTDAIGLTDDEPGGT